VVLNLALCCGAIWRHREKLQFRCITTLAPVHNYQKKILKNLLPIWLLVRTNLFAPSHFWIPDAKFDNCCWGYIAKSGKNSVLCSKILQWIFSWNLSDIYTKQCAQTFPPIFEVFTIYDHYFPKIVAPPSNENKNYLARLKEQSLLKKTLKTASQSTHQRWHKTCWKYTPSNEQRPGLRAWQKNTDIQTPYFRTYSWCALYYLPQTLHGDRACQDHQKR